MKRTALELSQMFRDAIASQNEDDYATLLEDINDSVGNADMSGYVSKEDYEKAIAERDAAVVKTQEYRDRYINRFYQPGTTPEDQTYIMGADSQKSIEEDEKLIGYDDLFEG